MLVISKVILLISCVNHIHEIVHVQVRGTLEAALKPSLKRGSSQRSSALKSALARAEGLLQEVTGDEYVQTDHAADTGQVDGLDSDLEEQDSCSNDTASRVDSSAADGASSETSLSSEQSRRRPGRFASAVSQVLRMVGQARRQLEADNEERHKAEQQAAEELKVRKERQRLEKERRQAEVKDFVEFLQFLRRADRYDHLLGRHS